MELRKFIATTIREYLSENFILPHNIWYHGTDKLIKGKPKVNLVKTNIKTKIGYSIPFEDLFYAFYVTKDFNWAKFYAPKTGNVYLVELFENYTVLDLSFITESTHLKNKSFFNVKNITQNFPFQIDFEEYAFNWLNKKRLLNNKNNLSKKEFVEKKIVDAFRPTSEYWFIDGLGSEALVDYIQEKKYDAVLFKRELAILNTNIIKNVKLKK